MSKSKEIEVAWLWLRRSALPQKGFFYGECLIKSPSPEFDLWCFSLEMVYKDMLFSLSQISSKAQNTAMLQYSYGPAQQIRGKPSPKWKEMDLSCEFKFTDRQLVSIPMSRLNFQWDIFFEFDADGPADGLTIRDEGVKESHCKNNDVSIGK